MQQVLWYIAVGIVLGIAVRAFVWRRKRKGGMSAHNVRRRMAKEENKAKILELIAEKGEVTNSQVQDALHIGDSTAARYLEELERQGRVEQLGNTGRFVKYRIK